MRPDVRVFDCGTVVLFRPVSREARRWFQADVAVEPWQWYGPCLAVNHRQAGGLVQELDRAGFIVEVEQEPGCPAPAQEAA